MNFLILLILVLIFVMPVIAGNVLFSDRFYRKSVKIYRIKSRNLKKWR